MPIDFNKKICFIHIPKTGGTSIEKNLDIMNKNNYWGGFKGRSMQHYLWNDYKNILNENYNNFFKFTIVRNPYDRIISEYYWNKDFGFSKKISFDDYLKQVSNIFQNNLFNNKNCNHFIPQHKFIYDSSNNLMIDKIFNFELFDEIYQYLIQNNYLEKIILNKKFNKRKRKGINLNQLTHEQKNIIYNLYKNDFILFNYQK